MSNITRHTFRVRKEGNEWVVERKRMIGYKKENQTKVQRGDMLVFHNATDSTIKIVNTSKELFLHSPCGIEVPKREYRGDFISGKIPSGDKYYNILDSVTRDDLTGGKLDVQP